MTIDELLTGASPKNYITAECQRMNLDATLLDFASVVPNMHGSQTVEQWVSRNRKNTFHIVFKYKNQIITETKHRQSQSGAQTSSETVVISEHVHRLADSTKTMDDINNRFEQLNARIEQLNARIEQLNADDDLFGLPENSKKAYI